MSEASTLRLKVAPPKQQDVGKGLIRIPDEALAALGIEPGAVLEVKGKRVTAATVAPAYPDDKGIEVARLDGLVRGNAGVGLGDTVELSVAEWKPARKIVVAPAREGLRLRGTGEALRPTLLHRPVVVGDVLSTSVARSPAGAPDGTFPAQPFALMEIRLAVTATNPKGIVRVTEETEIELLPEHSEAPTAGTEVTYDDLGGIQHVVEKVREMIELPLKHPELFDRLGIDPPRGVLLHGPPGTGKTLLAKAVANESDARFHVINGPEIMGSQYGESESRLREVFAEAEKDAPSILFIDELDSIAPKRAQVSGEVERRIVAQLLTLMDGMRADRTIIVIGATNRVDAIDEALRRPGRFDREIEVGIPDRDGRLEILHIHTRGMPLGNDVDLEHFAEQTRGYTGSDIAALAKEAALATLRRLLPNIDLDADSIPAEVLESLEVTGDDFKQGLKEVQPSALREILVQVPDISWDEVGGLDEVKNRLHELVELPLVKPESFNRLGIRCPKGVLLYGPPGTGKTLLAKAVANEAGANFLTAKGSTLLSKWYGESEQKVAAFFRRARQVAPAILFFDELDSLAPVRDGGPGSHEATERIVNQFLAEMDGMEELRGVAILGATNRPDRIDPALLRPGRFDELVHVPVPDAEARSDIFRAQAKGMALASDVDFERLIEITERFTGADIAAACMKAGLLAIRENAEAREIGMEHFYQAIQDTVPSITEEVERQYAQLEKKVKQQSVRIGFVDD
ncbi:MAG: CDC48 family AAA ATPase [Acidobacteriota bacterium]